VRDATVTTINVRPVATCSLQPIRPHRLRTPTSVLPRAFSQRRGRDVFYGLVGVKPTDAPLLTTGHLLYMNDGNAFCGHDVEEDLLILLGAPRASRVHQRRCRHLADSARAGDNAVASRPHRGRRILGAVIPPSEYHASQDS
jgi:hypothetical protein